MSAATSALRELSETLAPLVSGGADACLKGTPMIPLHRNTVAAIYQFLKQAADAERGPPKAICGYPIPGWRLQRVEHDDGRKGDEAPGWIVSLHSERPWDSPRSYNCVMSRSLIGPLEAWDEAISIALRENERVASAIETQRATTVGRGPKDESAVAATSGETHNPTTPSSSSNPGEANG